MELHERIIAYVEKHYPSSYTALEGIVLSKGFTLEAFYAALERVHQDKRVIQTTRRGEIYYSPYIPPVATPPPSHLTWLDANYPPMTPENDGSGIDLDLSFLFIKTKKERDEFKALASGRPVYMSKKKYAKRK